MKPTAAKALTFKWSTSGLTYGQFIYIRENIVNALGNLNVTTRNINGVAKNKLITHFVQNASNLPLKEFTVAPAANGLLSAANIIQIIMPRNKRILGKLSFKAASAVECVDILRQIGYAMVATLHNFIMPSLLDPEGEWTDEEKNYFRVLCAILSHMCLSLWPLEDEAHYYSFGSNPFLELKIKIM
jgi:hypothetical protein